jgi:DNA-binding transcriptional MerR regulator
MMPLGENMQIKDVIIKTGLTKKAVEYYEKQGLIRPETGENGYRRYTVADLAALREISLLRKLGLGVPEIREILSSADKPAALKKCIGRLEAELEASADRLSRLKQLAGDYDIGRAAALAKDADAALTIREKLRQAFPGVYGAYLGVHFGRFLNGRIDSEEKAEAYERIVAYLDGLEDMHFPSELEEYLEQGFSPMELADMERMDDALIRAAGDIGGFIADNRESIERYLEMRSSDEFKASPAYKLKQMLLAFQKENGYYDVFIPNLKVLSAEYRAYADQLESANKIFLEQFPSAKDI